MCVHGVCPEGFSECARCDDGWHGTLCDIPDEVRQPVGSTKASRKAKIADELDGEEIW